MKCFAFLCTLCLLLSGCSDTQQTVQSERSAPDAASIAQNTKTIESILTDTVWNYDKESVTFGNDFVISNTGENFVAICNASKQAGIDTKKIERGAEQTMLASVKLLNSDMSDAGTAYFSFEKRELLCGYYMYNGACYSLANKYPFEYKKPFSAVENKQISKQFNSVKTTTSLNSVTDISNGLLTAADGEALKLYKGSKSGIKRLDTFYFDGLMPTDASIYNDTICVLLASYETAEVLSENDFEAEESEQEIVRTKSEKIDFIDTNGDPVLPSLPLDLSVYTSAVYDGTNVFAARNNAIDVYKLEDGQWVKERRLGIEGAVEKLRISDIDGNQKNDYIISDGVNISVYTLDQRMQAAWKTKFDISEIQDFFISDLNGDGIKEIYVNESSGFVTGYILGADGFEVNDLSGEHEYYAAGDIDGDSNDDFMTLHLSEDDEDDTVDLILSFSN